MFVVLAGTASSMVFTTLAAYPLSRKKMAFRSTFTLIMVFTMMFSGGIVPTYLLMRSLHLINNRLVLIVSGLVSPYNMIIMKNFFQTIPESLEESAHIDGAGQFKILVNIILPLSAPVLATITLFYAVANWNAFFTCLLYITDRTKMVLQVLLRQLVITSEMNFAENLAAMDESTLNSLPIQDKSTTIIIATLPILLIYPFLQKYFVKGVLIGSVKG
ncbi:MAG: carbohydrate ABC transporter permease [Treponema sp.]|nr:carbohydrate ABC transporter permease [Treponema sp.]